MYRIIWIWQKSMIIGFGFKCICARYQHEWLLRCVLFYSPSISNGCGSIRGLLVSKMPCTAPGRRCLSYASTFWSHTETDHWSISWTPVNLSLKHLNIIPNIPPCVQVPASWGYVVGRRRRKGIRGGRVLSYDNSLHTIICPLLHFSCSMGVMATSFISALKTTYMIYTLLFYSTCPFTDLTGHLIAFYLRLATREPWDWCTELKLDFADSGMQCKQILL